MNINISQKSLKNILDSCESSPRFIKIFFKRTYGQGLLTDDQVSSMLRDTLQTIRGIV